MLLPDFPLADIRVQLKQRLRELRGVHAEIGELVAHSRKLIRESQATLAEADRVLRHARGRASERRTASAWSDLDGHAEKTVLY